MQIILGSQSKGRIGVLKQMGYDFEIMPSNIDEKEIRITDPKELTLALAVAKAEALKNKITKPALLITADSVVVWNGEIREKPIDAKEAEEFLLGYNKFPAEVVTSVAVTNTATGKQAKGTDSATAYFTPFSQKEIEDYIKQGDIFYYAGGFDIIGDWESHVQKIEGERESIIGLPKTLLEKLIQEVFK